MKFLCPKCDQSLEISEDLLGTDFPCSSCGHSMHVEPTSEKSQESDERMTDFSCVHCDGVIRASSTLTDTEIDCPHCAEITSFYFDEEGNESYDPYEKEETSSPHDEVKKAPTKKKEKRVVPNHEFGPRQIIGIVGSVLLLIGVFLPIAKVPLLGTINFFANGLGLGVFVFFFAVISLISILVRKEGLQLIMGLMNLGVLSLYLGQFLSAMQIMRSSISDFNQIASNFITLEWGWAVLVVSCGLLITPTFMKAWSRLLKLVRLKS